MVMKWIEKYYHLQKNQFDKKNIETIYKPINYHFPRYWDWSSAVWQQPLWREAWKSAERGGR